MTDDEFLRRFESADLEVFRHADHVRIAWIYLDRDGRDRALTCMLTGIRRFAEAKGATGKFHYTLTRAWLDLIADARTRHPGTRSAGALMAACPLLSDPAAIRQFYSPQVIQSDDARAGWVEPDRAPLDAQTATPAADAMEPMPNANPLAQFHLAVRHAENLGIDTAPAALGTADAQGRPSVRIVLLRGADDRGFVFHTNYASRKAQELADNPHAALCLHWPTLEEQIRIEGPVARLPADESDAYFAGRPRGSQIGAWASEQSQVLVAREVLEARLEEFEKRFEGQPVPRPPFWGGFRLAPVRIEFWYGRASRLHERIVYIREGDAWRIERLYP